MILLRVIMYKKAFFAIRIIAPEVDNTLLIEHLKEFMHTLTISH